MNKMQTGPRANLQAARKAAGLTQQQVAQHLKIGIRYYQSLESGERLGGIWMWDALEDLLGVHQRVLRHIGASETPSK